MYLYPVLAQQLRRADDNHWERLLAKTNATSEDLSFSCPGLAAVLKRTVEIFGGSVFTLHHQVPASLKSP